MSSKITQTPSIPVALLPPGPGHTRAPWYIRVHPGTSGYTRARVYRALSYLGPGPGIAVPGPVYTALCMSACVHALSSRHHRLHDDDELAVILVVPLI